MLMSKFIKITKSKGDEWYSNCIGKVFRVHSESRKGGKGKYVVQISGEDRKFMNGYPYGWVDKEDCELIVT